MDPSLYLLVADLVGIIVFALSGVLLAHQKSMDGIGVIVLAAVTAIGGGTVRDIIINVPVFWLTDTIYIYVILFSGMAGVLWLNKFHHVPHKTLEILDALGLALFVLMGTSKALAIGLPAESAIIMGVITGCFGGVIRDVLANEIPMLFRKELYATSAVIGATVHVLLQPYSLELSLIAGFLFILLSRLIALKLGLGVPVFRNSE